jgi:hypothetical protein
MSESVMTIANEMAEAWKAVRQGDGEFTLDAVDNWVTRLKSLRLYDCQICGGLVDLTSTNAPTVSLGGTR